MFVHPLIPIQFDFLILAVASSRKTLLANVASLQLQLSRLREFYHQQSISTTTTHERIIFELRQQISSLQVQLSAAESGVADGAVFQPRLLELESTLGQLCTISVGAQRFSLSSSSNASATVVQRQVAFVSECTATLSRVTEYVRHVHTQLSQRFVFIFWLTI
jgi:hypothetical protein